MQVKKQQSEPNIEQQTDSKLEEEYNKGVYCHSAYLFNLYAEYIMQNAGMDESQTGIKIAERNINNLKYAENTALMEEREEELKNVMRVKEKSEKAGLKLNIKKTKIMASSSITSWQINGEKYETVTFSWAPKSVQIVTAAMKLKNTCSLEGKL